MTEGPVLAVFGHPDDAEIAAGGTLAKWCADGREVHLLTLTNGDRGSEDPKPDRAELAVTRAVESWVFVRTKSVLRRSLTHSQEFFNIRSAFCASIPPEIQRTSTGSGVHCGARRTRMFFRPDSTSTAPST